MTVPIVGQSTVLKDQILEYLLKINPNAPREVVDLYYELESTWGIKADLLLAQNFHETDFLRSWWSQAPRRNPAGVGVTGHSQTTDPNSNAFAFKQEDNKWYQGYSFADWRAAAQAHFAHMSGYVYADERNNASQLSPRYKALKAYMAQQKWPLAQLITDLNGKWAVPGTTYGQTIVKLLNQMAGRPANATRSTTAVSLNDVAAPNIVDLTSKLSQDNYSGGRAGLGVKLIVLHDTAGTSANPDSNSLQINFSAREQGTINWFLSGGAASIHYMIGPEATGAKIYRLCREEDTAWHAAGKPTRNVFVAPDGTRLEGSLEGVSKVNRGSIGIERWGIPNEAVGTKQTQALISLVVDIARRYALKPEQVTSHQFLQTDRSDGNVLLDECRAAVTALWTQPAATTTTNQAATTPAAATTAQEPLPIKVNPVIVITQSFGTVRIPETPQPTQDEHPEAPPTEHAEATPDSAVTDAAHATADPHNVPGYTDFQGVATINFDNIPVRAEPSSAAAQLRDIDTGAVVRVMAFTDQGTDQGAGTRWYLIDPADGGGWLYNLGIAVS